jgi:hypothetical protein
LSVSAAVWAISRTGSVFLATWCFFLVQALFVTIPPTVQRKTAMEQDHPSLSGNFERAQRQADAALHQLISKRTTS